MHQVHKRQLAHVCVQPAQRPARLSRAPGQHGPALDEMLTHFNSRDYETHLLKTAREKANNTLRSDLLSKKEDKKSEAAFCHHIFSEKYNISALVFITDGLEAEALGN